MTKLHKQKDPVSVFVSKCSIADCCRASWKQTVPYWVA